MAFKMKSGNKVSFKNMGSSSPGKQGLGQTESTTLPSGNRIEGLQIKEKGEKNKGLVAEEKRVQKLSNKTNKPVDTTTNKESKIDGGDTKSEWNFDFMELLKSFLSSGGGGGLRAAAGAALTKKSPNELLAMQKARETRKEKKKQTVQERASEKFIKED